MQFSMSWKPRPAMIPLTKACFIVSFLQISKTSKTIKSLANSSADCRNYCHHTGAKSRVLPIPGLLDSAHVYDSTGIQNLEVRPDKLAIIGGGNIGLEFAGLYSKLGSQVTVYEASSAILP